MFSGLLEAQKDAHNSYTLLQESLAKQLQNKIDDQTLVNMAIGDNLKQVEKINAEKSVSQLTRTGAKSDPAEDDQFGRLGRVFALKKVDEMPMNNIADEIMEEFVFETSKPVFEGLKRIEQLKSLKKWIENRLNKNPSWEEKVVLKSNWIQTEFVLKSDATFAFLANETDLSLGPLTLQVILPVPELPASGV